MNGAAAAAFSWREMVGVAKDVEVGKQTTRKATIRKDDMADMAEKMLSEEGGQQLKRMEFFFEMRRWFVGEWLVWSRIKEYSEGVEGGLFKQVRLLAPY